MHQNVVVALGRVARAALAEQPLGAVVDGVARQVPARVVHRVDVAHPAKLTAEPPISNI